MDLLEFTASMTASLAWPILIAMLVLIFKKQITNVIGRITKISAAGVDIDVDALLDRTEIAISDLPPPQSPEQLFEPEPEQEPKPVIAAAMNEIPEIKYSVNDSIRYSRGPIDPELTDAVIVNPSGVVMEEWGKVIATADAMLSRMDGPTKTHANLNTHTLFSTLRGAGVISAEEQKLIFDMRRIRNAAAHGTAESITAEEAFRFKRIAEELIRRWTIIIDFEIFMPKK